MTVSPAVLDTAPIQRRKAVWNDGTPIDWTAFETTWKANNGSDEAYKVSSTDNWKNIESVTKGATDKDVIVTFKGKFAWPEAVFSTILNPKVNSADAFKTAYVENAHPPEWGAGPYKLTKFDTKCQSATLEPNEKWWGGQAAARQGHLHGGWTRRHASTPSRTARSTPPRRPTRTLSRRSPA